VTEKTFRVEGMSCGHCKAAVEHELNDLSGVERSSADFERSSADFERGTVEVAYDEDRLTTEDIKGAVEAAGYTLVA
jgi:copper chaperone